MRLLFIHGWGQNGRVWRLQESLAAEFKMETIDLPGHGAPERWDRPDLSPGLGKVGSALAGDEPTVAVGWSLGGQLLLALGGRAPACLKGIVTVGSTPSFVRRPGFSGGITPARARTIRDQVAADFEAALRKFRPVNFSIREKNDPSFPDWTALLESACAGLVGGDLLTCLDGILRDDSRARVAEIGIPVLVVHGTSDAVCPVEAAGFLIENLRDGRLRELPEAGHVPFITRSDAFNRMILEFASEVDGR
jgi:pimeloyl-[acyl-carrier protein] methyl ester esterase